MVYRIRQRRDDRILFIVLLSINLAVALFLAGQVIALRAYPFDTDEAAHALPALRMARELGQGDLSGFLREVYQQDFYPPGAAVFLTPAYLIAGPSPTVARLTSVACLFLAVLVIFGLAREIDPRRGALAGLIAGLLTLAARPLLTASSLVMLEAPGLLLSLLLLWSYLRAARRATAGRLLLASLLLAATFLTKYTYGLVGLAAIAASECIEWRSGTGRRIPARWSILFGPFVAILLVWFMQADKAAAFFDYTQPQSDNAAWLSPANLLYYPRSLARHSLPSAAFGLVTAAGLVWAAARWRRPSARILLLYFLFGMAAVMLVNHPPNPRFIATFIPAAHVPVGLMIAGLIQRPRRRISLTTTAAALTVMMVILIMGLPPVIARYRHLGSVLQAQVETSPLHNDVDEWIAETLPPRASIFLINYWDQFSPPVLEWELATNADTVPPPVAGEVLEPATPARAAALRRAVERAGMTHVVVVEGGPWGAPFWPDYTAAFGDNLIEIGRESFRLPNYEAGDWLDNNAIDDADWEQIKVESFQTLDVGIILYEIRD